MALLVGRGKYLLQEEIGQGIYGITYKAINQTNNEVVVIKTFKPELSQETETSKLRKKFLNEAQRLLECSHPNIIPYREFFSEDGVPYIVMDYVAGKTLDKVVLPDNPLPEATAIKYIRQIGEALKVVHSKGLLHRDIKPQNLILSEDNQQVILIDFGIAKEFNQKISQSNTTVVQDNYAPIERYFSKAKPTPATDVYGLAATLYTLVTAQVPIAAIVRENFSLPSPQNMQPKLSNQISEVIMLGMALEPEARPDSVEEWLALLPQSNKNSNLFTAFRSKSRQQKSSVTYNSSLLEKNKPVNSDQSESVKVVETTSVKQSGNNNQLFKWLTIGLLILLGIDYVWLKFQVRFQDSPTRPNTTQQR